MVDLAALASRMGALDGASGLPPVEKWTPDYCGELDLVIRRDGLWLYQGTPIGRPELVRLFSTILKREGEDFFLVTPVEKMKIRVEDTPFLAVSLEVTRPASAAQCLTFRTLTGDEASIGPDHPLSFRPEQGGQGALVPVYTVRRNLEARVARGPYYQLMDLVDDDPDRGPGLWSGGAFFPLTAP